MSVFQCDLDVFEFVNPDLLPAHGDFVADLLGLVVFVVFDDVDSLLEFQLNV